MRLKVGQKVRVRSWKDLTNLYGLKDSGNIKMPYGYVRGQMCKFLNKIVTIGTIHGKRITIQEYHFTWHRDMFKPMTVLSFKNIYTN